MSCVIAGDRGIVALRFAGDLSYHQCSIFLPSLGPIRAVGGGERSLCVGSWMGCVAEVAEPRTSPRHRPVGPALRRIRLWALSCPSAHIRVCCRARGASAAHGATARAACGEDGPTDGTWARSQRLRELGGKLMLADGLPPRDRGRGALKWSTTNQSGAEEDQPLN